MCALVQHLRKIAYRVALVVGMVVATALACGPAAAFDVPPLTATSDAFYKSIDDACVPVTLDYYLRERSDSYFSKHSYEIFDSKPRQYLISLMVTPDHDVWAFGEFNRGFYHLPKRNGKYADTADYHAMPISVKGDSKHPSSDSAMSRHAPFMFHGARTTLSILGEEIARDEYGRLWFSQGGDAYFSTSYGRLVSFDPKADPGEQFCVYNVPDKGSSIIGMGWDAANDQLWFSQGSLAPGVGALVSFKPDEMRCANDYVWELTADGEPKTPLPYQYCKERQTRGCFKKYSIPDAYFPVTLIVDSRDKAKALEASRFTSGHPAHIVVPQPPHIDAGKVWFTLYYGDAIGRLNPSLVGSRQSPFSFFPIGWERYSTQTQQAQAKTGLYVPNSASPWDIDISNDGNIVFTAYSARAIVQFDIGRYSSPQYSGECERETGGPTSNPCMQIMPVPRLEEHHRVHSLSIDPWGNTWFGVSHPTCRLGNSAGSFRHEPGSVGFVNAAWDDLVYFDHLGFDTPEDRAANLRIDLTGRTTCDRGEDIDWSFTGIDTDVDGDTFSVWFTDADGKIRQLKYRYPYSDGDIYCHFGDCVSGQHAGND